MIQTGAAMNPPHNLRAPPRDPGSTAEIGRGALGRSALQARALFREWAVWAIESRGARRGEKRAIALILVGGLHALAATVGAVSLLLVSPVVIVLTVLLAPIEAWLAILVATTVGLRFLPPAQAVVYTLIQIILGLLVVFLNIGVRGQMRQRIRAMGERLRTDPVTGALTRQALHDDFAKMTAGGLQPWKSLIFIDVDNFKQVNDRFGHIVGDTCLHMISDRLQSAILDPDERLYRYGGDEFLVLSPGDINRAWRRADDILGFLRANPLIDDFVVTVSIGLAPVVPGTPLADNIRRGDKALYRAKLAGRNAVGLVSESLSDQPETHFSGAEEPCPPPKISDRH